MENSAGTPDSGAAPAENPPALRAAPFAKGGFLVPPFAKGGDRGDLLLHDSSRKPIYGESQVQADSLSLVSQELPRHRTDGGRLTNGWSGTAFGQPLNRGRQSAPN